jgi:hypothetical protein
MEYVIYNRRNVVFALLNWERGGGLLEAISAA